MLEIVFNKSSEGALKVAQHCGERSIKGCSAALVLPETDRSACCSASCPPPDRVHREDAVSLGGAASDIFCFCDDYSIGEIRGDGFSQERIESLRALFSLYPFHLEYRLEIAERSRDLFEKLLRRATQGEPLRIWYSSAPHEVCGICWFLTQLQDRLTALPPITAIKLPHFVQNGSTLTRYLGWGEVAPEEFYSFLPYEEKILPSFLTACSIKWNQLQGQNAMLRAVINGDLQSVPESFYDSFIENELSQMEDEFYEAFLIENLIGKYQLSIGDEWFALRIEKMIQDGRLISLAQENDCGYRKYLKKVK